MALTFVDFTADGSATKPFSFPSYQESDIVVEVDGVVKTVTTHYNLTNYTTTGGGQVVFTTNNIPVSPSLIRIKRKTDVTTNTGDADPKATFQAGSSIKADDLNNNQKQALFAVGELQEQTIVTTKIKDQAVTTAKIFPDAVDGTKIADDSINSEHYVDGSIDTAHIADLQVTTAKIAADAVNGSKIADDSINSEHYVDGSIDTAHIADSQVTTAKIADLNVSTGKLADSGVTTLKIADSNVTTAKLATDAVTTVKITDSNVTTAKLADSGVTTAKIADANVTTAKLAADAVTNAKIADDSIDSEHYVDGSIDTAHIADSQITTAKIAADAVTVGKIADGELKTLAGMQSGTASVLADSTALTATTAELNQLDGITLETTLTSSDTRIPTSKAVNDQILAVTNALGGFVAIANETSFPATNPDPSNGAGTVVSISQISSGSAVSVNNQGTATISNGAGTGNTVTITGFPSTLQNTSLAQNSGLQVQTTTTLHTYTFHKQLASADDIQAISATVNSFSNRYRVSSSAPTSSLDGGDLWYDTTNNKLMVYNSTEGAWEETTAIGNFFISTLSSSSSTGGGSATPNGSAYRFTLSQSAQSAQQLIVSVDGVIQKPNSGTSQPSEGYAIDGNDIIFGSAPVNGADIFITVLGSSVGIGTPSNNTVTSAILQNGSVIAAKIAGDAVDGTKIADDAINSEHYVDGSIDTQHIADLQVTTAKIAASAVTEAKIGNHAVTAVKLATDAVTDTVLADHSSDDSLRAVGTNHIKDDAVTGDKIADLSIGQNLIQVGAVETAKIGTSAVTTVKLADDSVTTAKIVDDAVTTAKIANANVTNDKLGPDIPANKLQVNDANIIIGDAGNDGALQALSGDVTMTRTGVVTIANNAVSTAKIADQAVTLAKLEHGTSSNDGKFLRANNGADPTFETITIPASFVSGMIIMYNSATAPSGWYLCDGNNGTPDLRDRFIIGAGSSYSLNATGGATTDTANISVSVSGTTGGGGGGYTAGLSAAGGSAISASGHTHSFSGSGSGSDTINTVPPYYALTFIMKA